VQPVSGRGRTPQELSRIGAISLVVALILMAAALNLQKFPGMRGTSYQAEFSDGSGLRPGNMVQVAGVQVGRVDQIELAGDHVIVHFDVDGGRELGKETSASVEVLNLLGEKFLNLVPAGEEKLRKDATIPLERTDSSYDIVKVFSKLADTTEGIDIPQLQQALSTVGDTMDRTSDEASATFDGLARLSEAIASRDAELESLLARAESVSTLLAERKGDIVTLIKDADLILKELRRRKEAIHSLLVNATTLARELGGLVDDNQRQIGPMLADLKEVTDLLVKREKQMRAVIRNFGPYTRILSNIIGTGPWFDAYAVNLYALPSGEFQPEKR
jgi:phospholipid/cholesterol/gamma-HCH transport system substrate-binding protein